MLATVVGGYFVACDRGESTVLTESAGDYTVDLLYHQWCIYGDVSVRIRNRSSATIRTVEITEVDTRDDAESFRLDLERLPEVLVLRHGDVRYQISPSDGAVHQEYVAE